MASIFKPHPYQAYAIRRIIDDPAVGLFLGMGLGKTVICLTAVDSLIYDYLSVGRVLVIAPKKVAEATWQTEAAKWEHLRRLSIATAVGNAKQRIAAVDTGADITVINRENTEWLCEQYGQVWPFDMVIVDECSSFKNPAAKRFRALRRQLGRISRIVILTGTPAPNGIEDLWSQIYLLDRGARLGAYVTHYRERYFDHNPWRHEYIPKPGAFEAVQEKISDICVSMSAADYLRLPDLVVHDFPVALDPAGQSAYGKMERDMLLELGEDQITAMTAAALTGKLLQLCGGCVYDADGGVHEIHTAKLDALAELVEALNGEPALLFYGYRHELPGLRRVLKGRRVLELTGAEAVDAWNAGKADILLAHPASCAYGLNLQQGGRHIIWYTLTWSLEQYQQANARLYRQGQERPVIVHRLLVRGGMDEDVASALESKTGTQDALLDALKLRRERMV